jgi:acetylornithine deacetylase
MTKFSREISDYVLQNKHRHEAFLQSLIKADTTDGSEDNGQTVWISRLRDLPCELDIFEPDPNRLSKYDEYNEGHVYVNRPNVVATFAGDGSGKSLILNGHMDTVFPGSLEKWSFPPWDATIQDGKMFGLGSCDMKAGLAALLLAMELICKLKIPLRGNVYLQSVVDEEAGGGNGTLACIDRGYTADAALVAEPTTLIPMSAHVGSVAFRVSFRGMACHSNMKWEGVNSIEKALPFLNRLRELEQKWQSERHHPLLPSPIISINTIDAGDGAVLLPASCIVEGNFTYLPGWDQSISEFTNELESAVAEDEWLSENPPVLQFLHNVKPYASNPQGSWPLCVEYGVSEILNKQIPVSGFPTGADARLLANIGNMPTIILGPGNIRRAHTENEFVELDQFHQSIELYAYIIANWAG